MSSFAFDPVNPLLHICLDCTRSKSNAHAQRQKPTQVPKAQLFLKNKLILPVIQSKDRLAYFSEESEAQSYQVLVPCSTAGICSNV